jgi:hypothetical protein
MIILIIQVKVTTTLNSSQTLNSNERQSFLKTRIDHTYIKIVKSSMKYMETLLQMRALKGIAISYMKEGIVRHTQARRSIDLIITHK